MKTNIFALAALSTVTSAFPKPAWLFGPQTPPPEGTQLYSLQSKSYVWFHDSADTTTSCFVSMTDLASATLAVNNQWVTLRTGQSDYTLTGTQGSAAKFFLVYYSPTATYKIHNSDDTRQVALQGPNGVLLYLVDAFWPSEPTIPGGQLMEWATFTTDNDVLGVKDGSTLPNRTFVAVRGLDGGYGIALYDGASNTTQTISPITLAVVKV